MGYLGNFDTILHFNGNFYEVENQGESKVCQCVFVWLSVFDQLSTEKE